jgi:hypothetical protein
MDSGLASCSTVRVYSALIRPPSLATSATPGFTSRVLRLPPTLPYVSVTYVRVHFLQTAQRVRDMNAAGGEPLVDTGTADEARIRREFLPHMLGEKGEVQDRVAPTELDHPG